MRLPLFQFSHISLCVASFLQWMYFIWLVVITKGILILIFAVMLTTTQFLIVVSHLYQLHKYAHIIKTTNFAVAPESRVRILTTITDTCAHYTITLYRMCMLTFLCSVILINLWISSNSLHQTNGNHKYIHDVLLHSILFELTPCILFLWCLCGILHIGFLGCAQVNRWLGLCEVCLDPEAIIAQDTDIEDELADTPK